MEDTLNICEGCQDIFQSGGEDYCPGCSKSLENDTPESQED
jgi:hypothetical protein